jgi:hypothetical protein
MAQYKSPITVAAFQAGWLHDESADASFLAFLLDCLEAATERVYSYCNWDFTKLSQGLAGAAETRWVRFQGKGTPYHSLNFSATIPRYWYDTPVTDQSSQVTRIANFLPNGLIKIFGQNQNEAVAQDGLVFTYGQEQEIEFGYAAVAAVPTPDAVIEVICKMAARSVKESGWGDGTFGQASETAPLSNEKVPMLDFTKEWRDLLQPFRVVAV